MVRDGAQCSLWVKTESPRPSRFLDSCRRSPSNVLQKFEGRSVARAQCGESRCLFQHPAPAPPLNRVRRKPVKTKQDADRPEGMRSAPRPPRPVLHELGRGHPSMRLAEGFPASTCGLFFYRSECIGLSSASLSEVPDSRDQVDQASRIMEDKMPESNQDHAANLHIYAAHAHTAAAAAHRRGDHETAGELSSSAQEFSSKAAEKTQEVARRIPVRLRA